MNKMIVLIALVVFFAFEVYYFQLKQPKTNIVSEDSQKESPSQPPQDLQEQTIENFHIVDTKQQSKELDLWSQTAHKPMGSSEWKLQDVKVQFYSENVTYTVTGQNGRVDEIKKTMFIQGNVKLSSSNGYDFYTDHLSYDPEKRRIITEVKVSLEGPPEKDGRLFLEGIGLDVNMMTNMMIMQNQVKGYKSMSENRMMYISSDRAEFSGKMKSVVFRNNVLIKVGAMRVRGNFANFQYKDGRLDTLFMDGGIHLQDPDKTGSSGEAIVYFNEDKYIFRKKPFITQNDNELIGDEVIIFNGGKRVQVKNAKIEYHQTEKQQ